MRQSFRSFFRKERNLLIAILLLALANGLLYAFIVPPWQHYDEPNHFEYIWLLVERIERPHSGDYDSAMRQWVAQSMVEHGFYDGWGTPPDLTSEKPWIGQYSQLDEPLGYYLLAGLPWFLLPSDAISAQLYAARLVSLVLFLVTVLAGWGLVVEITPEGHPMRFLIPMTMALLPGYVDLMTSVNNDVGAIAVFSLFLWSSLRLVRRGPSFWTLLAVLITTGLCLITKRTVYIALPLLGIALLFAFLRGKLRILAWGLVILSGILGILLGFSWGDTALWYRDTSQEVPTRISLPQAPEGGAALRLVIQPGASDVKLVQMLPVKVAKPLSGQPLTLGGWIWATQPLEINSIQLGILDGRQIFGEQVEIDQTPQFFALTVIPTGNTATTWVLLEPGKNLDIDQPVEIFYDGLVLTQGSFSADQPPIYAEDSWGGAPYDNLLRNGSAESSWFYLRPWADALASQFFSDYAGQESFSLTIYSLLDWPSSGWYYQLVGANLFRTYWAKFGWAHVPLMGAKPYARILLPFTVLAFIGVGVAFWQRWHRLAKLPWDALFLLGITILIVWGLVIIRGSTYLLIRPYFAVARYAYPAIIPTVLFLCTGWMSVLSTLERWLRLPGWVKYAVYLGLFLLFNVYALFSILAFYR
jgi:hypothetical protein